MDGTFPEGLLIGTVMEIENTNSLSLLIRPQVDYRSIQAVLVIPKTIDTSCQGAQDLP